MTDSLESGAGRGLGQEQGVEGNGLVPPATYVEVKQCALHLNDFSRHQCQSAAVDGGEFCEEDIDVKLCKASGITYQSGGNSWGWFKWLNVIPPHPVDAWGERTKRALFCSDRCRNLWRDTKTSRERLVEVSKIVVGGRSERYEIIKNYSNTGQDVVLDKNTSRIVIRHVEL